MVRTNNKIQAVIFRMEKDGPKFLIMRRIGGMNNDVWQSVTGGVESGETLDETLKREVFEETGIRPEDIIKYEKIMEFSFESDGTKKNESVFEVEVRPDVVVTDKNNVYKEHDKWDWVEENTAVSMVKWDNNKEAIKKTASKYKIRRQT
jgi:8-oxo-dGTP pyrophosphatase MutT (NUDIX family)